MKSGLIGALIAAFIFVFSFSSAAAEGPPARNFIPEFSGVILSPDGERVATIRPHNNRNAIVIYRFDDPPGEGGEHTLIVPSGEGVDIIAYVWAGPRRLFVVAGFAHQNVNNFRQVDWTAFGTHFMSLDISTGRLVFFRGLRNGASLIDPLPDDPEHIMIQEPSGAFLRPALLDITDGSKDYLERGRAEWGRFALDRRNRPRALITQNVIEQVTRIFWRRADGVSWREAHRLPLLRGGSAEAIGILEHDDGEYLYFMSNMDRRNAVYRYRLESQGEAELVYMHDRHDVFDLTYNPQSGARYYVEYIGDVYQRHYFRRRSQQLDEALNEYLPGDYAYAMSSANDRYVVQSFSPGRPSQVHLYDANTGALTYFAPRYIGLEEGALANISKFDYTARDGLEIPGYLAVPQGMEEGPQPVLVWPHGGPFARDTMMFDPIRQYLASNGVLVFSPNFRGSTGYGNAFVTAGRGQWGLAMQTDVIDGVQALIDQGIADPDRICIGGWSYGAYVALYAAVETPDLFRCAIGVNGVYDVESYRDDLGSIDAFGIPDFHREERWGEAANDRARLRRLSPTHRADEITIPVLIIASAEDPIVDISHAEDLIDALHEAGRTPQTLLIEEGDHSMNYGESFVQTFETMGAFVREHLH